MTTISSSMASSGSVQWGPPPKPPKGMGGPGGPGGPQGAQGSEAPPSLADVFSQIDTDGDGSLSESELKSALEGQSSSDSTAASSEAAASTSANSMSGFGMDTQGFAGMMGGMPPPPPPPPGDSSSGDEDAQQDLFSAIDTDGDGGLSQEEVKGFEEKMRALFESMQQMGMGGTGSTDTSTFASASSAVSLMA